MDNREQPHNSSGRSSKAGDGTDSRKGSEWKIAKGFGSRCRRGHPDAREVEQSLRRLAGR
jgi:hypothetical protein